MNIEQPTTSRFEILTHWNELDKNEKLNLQNIFLRSTSIFGFLLVASVIIYCFISVPGTTTNTSFLLAFILLIGFLSVIRMISTGTERINETFFMGFGGVVIAIIGFLIYFFNGMGSNSKSGFLSGKMYQYFSIGLLILIVLVGLGFFFLLAKNWLYQQTGFVGFIINVIFYIPCLLVDLFATINEELKITSNALYLMFFAELIFICAYFGLGPLYSRLIGKKKYVLMDKPEFLRTEKTFKIEIPIPQKITKDFHKNPKNMGIGGWFYINSNQPQTEDYLIFNLQNTFATDTCSSIRLIYDTTNSATPIILTHNKQNIAIEGFGLQRWNYLFFNIENSMLYFYVNGVLNTTFTIEPCFFDFSNAKKDSKYYLSLTIGENEGISGAVRNVEYYHDSLLPYFIAEKYNVLRTVYK